MLQIPTGKNPRGIIVNSTDTTAYVMNYVSRDVTVIDLSGRCEAVAATMRSANLPAAGTPEDRIHIGKELYHTSVGEFDPRRRRRAITGRMSNNGWGSCSSCHPFGLTDNVVWIFPSGPEAHHLRSTRISIRPIRRAARFRALELVGERDEEADFELNIRAVSGGQGTDRQRRRRYAGHRTSST